LESSISSFYTENLEKGFQFMYYTNFFDTIASMVDTFHLDNRNKEFAEELQTLTIVPVLMKYKDVPKEKQIKYIFGLRTYTARIYGRTISFLYDNTTYDIIEIVPFPVKKRRSIMH